MVALALLVTAGAADAPHPLQVVNGSAHGGSERVKVSFVVRNVGATDDPPIPVSRRSLGTFSRKVAAVPSSRS
jgi:hypothetical protein